ncbi:MAG: hypothetical protein ACD_18C00095G0002 [uncultured bacterium]|nr:MAG: hypothetical protein ACD_18C00095G0002 [uncultured bacterium]OGH83617.1 MAG: hypothetical protein A2488_01535 [Candidatus Magasanikbacteria bacterium RIFOXYC12_FULL_32_21b]OGH91340.1 MAG: hypothetical protein A2507_04770 [Candidatus Magasanikbacteria bacterium RIFOXYD12_FULL_33_17]HAO51839.1 hypothetical protein [Candidatus Magasanikbacteria bacterium]
MKFFTKKIKSPVKQSRDYTRLKKIKVINIFLLIIVIFTLTTTFLFIYNNVYKTLGQIADVTLIKNNQHLESINFTQYNSAVSAWQGKNIDEDILVPKRDPFNVAITIPTSTPKEP